MTGTRDLESTAQNCHICNGGIEHGPLWFSVLRLPRNLGEVFSVVGLEDLPDRGLGQMFPTDHRGMFGSFRSVRRSHAQTYCSLWTSSDEDRSLIKEQHLDSDQGGHSFQSCTSRCPCHCPHEHWSPQVEHGRTLSEHKSLFELFSYFLTFLPDILSLKKWN